MRGAPRGPPFPAVPAAHPSQYGSPSLSAAPSLAGAHRSLAPTAGPRPPPLICSFGTWPAGMGARLRPRAGVPLPATRSQRRRPPRSSAPHLPSSGPGAPALLGWPPAKCPLSPLVVGAPALNSAAWGRCSPGRPSTPQLEGPSPSAPFAAPLPEGLSDSPTLKELLSPAHLTPSLPATFSSPRSLCQESSILGLGAPGVSGESLLAPPAPCQPLQLVCPPGWRVASHQNRIRRWAPCSQV